MSFMPFPAFYSHTSAKYLSPLASSLTSISYNILVPFSTQGQKLTAYSSQVCCHFCHSFFDFKLLIVRLLCEMLKVTATKIKTILGFCGNNICCFLKHNIHSTSPFFHDLKMHLQNKSRIFALESVVL